ncbi:hypothetical protein MD484_g1715, partial [Candolleomyces efflorescens]
MLAILNKAGPIPPKPDTLKTEFTFKTFINALNEHSSHIYTTYFPQDHPRKHPHPHETSALLIDFNNAEILDEKRNMGQDRTGTPGFVARAVDKGGPLPPPEGIFAAGMPDAPDRYRTQHPERYAKFKPSSTQPIWISKEQDYKDWRHELDHELESVFWVLIFWLMSARPVGKANEPIANALWANFVGTWQDRNRVLSSPLPFDTRSFHSTFGPAINLANRLALTIKHDRFWLLQDDQRRHVDFTAEAFQRLTLQFILDHAMEDFMTCKIDINNPRVREKTPTYLTISFTVAASSQAAEQHEKRSFEQDVRDDGQSKRQRLRAGSDEVVEEDSKPWIWEECPDGCQAHFEQDGSKVIPYIWDPRTGKRVGGQ